MGKSSLTFQITEVDLVVINIKRLRNLAIEMFPDYIAAKQFRLWVPKYVADLIILYNRTQDDMSTESINEGGKLFDFPLFFNSVDEITLGILDFHFFEENVPRITMTKFMTDRPIFK